MDAACLLSKESRSIEGIQQSDLERWRQAGYAAVNKLVVELKDQIVGKDIEEMSLLLREEGKKLTAALFEQMINSLGKEELQAKTIHVLSVTKR